MPSDRWSEADREPVVRALARFGVQVSMLHSTAQVVDAVLDALAAAGWQARCDCDGVVHDLPILRAHLRGEPGCEAARTDRVEVTDG